ncbi:ATP-dependent DNA helicase DDX11 [Ditylenchus destructor]|nr:ATP-dependent DNA helicase DDX11 [Ditylenchus destructor]
MESKTPENSFSFPYTPYPIQDQLMTAIYQAIDKRKVAIFESPTGTGKSLSTICASLTWLEHFEEKQQEDLSNQMQMLMRKIQVMW